ncbi:hemolysin family protein [Schaalia sp. lx-100]|nr:hemolysin family protein [Schaalia sp. lx-260]MCD4556734.1 hemolysin family protein [Schaalia sp. lx-100]
MVDIVMLLFGVVLTAGTFLFVSAEFSLVALDQAVVERRAAEGDKGATQVLRATRTLSTQLSGAQIGITLTTILLGYTTQTTLASLLTALFGYTGIAYTLSATIAVTLAAVIINMFSMLFGELVPKNLALAHPLQTARAVVPFHMAFTAVTRPIILLLGGIANWVLARMGIEPQEEISAARSASELAALVRHSAQEGTLDVSTASLLTNSIRISALTAVDVMTDRGLMHSLPEDSTAADVIALARETGHSRFPVIGQDSDDVLAFVSLRRAIAVPYEKRGEVPVLSQSLRAEAPCVPETLELGPLMLQLRDEGLQIAVVVDEYGGVSGIVTLEDVVEEIVGEVSDEHDQRRLGIRTRHDGSLLIPGTLRPDELLERTGVALPADGPWDTIAGLVITRLGRLPVVGDEIVESHYRLEVTQIQGRRITHIALAPREQEGEQ